MSFSLPIVNDDGEEVDPDLICRVPGVSWIEDPDLRLTVFPEAEYLIDGELPVGYTVVMGAPKVGKTALMLPMAHRLVRRGKRVLYIALDDSLRRMRNRTVMANPKNDKLTGLWYVTSWNPRGRDDAFFQLGAWLDHCTAAGNHFDVVIIDTYGRYIGRRPPGADVFGFDYETGQKFKILCEAHTCSVIITHHTRKGGTDDGGDWLEQMSGSAGMAASADSIWLIERTRGGRDGLLRITGNDMEEVIKPVVLGGDMVWRPAYGISPAQARHRGIPRAILDYLMDGPVATITQLRTAIGCTENTLHSALGRLRDEGVVEFHEGVWALTHHKDNGKLIEEFPEVPDTPETAHLLPEVQTPIPGMDDQTLREQPEPELPAFTPPPAPFSEPVPDSVAPVNTGSQATSKLIEILTGSRLHPVFRITDEVKRAIPYDRMCLGGKPNQWTLFPSTAPAGRVLVLDRKAAYFAANPWLAPNVLTRRGPMEWEQIHGDKFAGVFEIASTPWIHKNLPSPYGADRPRPRELVTRPTLNRLYSLAKDNLMEFPKILSGYVGKGSERLLGDWFNWCLLQRRMAAADAQLAANVKNDQNVAIGSMRIVTEGKTPGVVDRWDWQYAIHGHHNGLMNYYAIKSLTALEPLIGVGMTDELVFEVPEGEDPGAWIPPTMVDHVAAGRFAVKTWNEYDEAEDPNLIAVHRWREGAEWFESKGRWGSGVR